MNNENADNFWARYKQLAIKDFHVLLKTGISQGTLSSWKTRRTFPTADKAYHIAKALNTTVEYLVSGTDKKDDFSPVVREIAEISAEFTDEDFNILKSVAEGIKKKYKR